MTTTHNKESGSSVTMVDEQVALNLSLYAKETMSSVTRKNEQFGFDIFADDQNIDADSVAYYCDGADAMWNELAPSVVYIDHDLFVYANLSEMITLTDVINITVGYKQTLQDAMTMLDVFSHVISFTRELPDSITMSDLSVLIMGTALGDTTTMSDVAILVSTNLLTDESGNYITDESGNYIDTA